MSIYDIIEEINKSISFGKKFLLLHRSVKIHPTFKVYKKFCYNLYLVDPVDNKECILSHEGTKNTPSDEMDVAWEEQDRIFLSVLIKWIASPESVKLRKDGI